MVNEDNTKQRKLVTIAVVGVFVGVVLAIVANYLSSSLYPFGSDSMGHIFKLEQLYSNWKENGTILTWTNDWYLGHDLLRYYPPLVYFLGLAGMVFVGNATVVYKAISVGALLVGGVSMLLYSRRWLSPVAALFTALIYVIFPYTIRTIFDEGNLPRALFIAIFPFLFFESLFLIQKKKVALRTLLIIICSTWILLLAHTMQAVQGLLSIVILVTVGVTFFPRFRESPKRILLLACSYVVAILLAFFWIVPAYVFPELPGFSNILSPEKLSQFSTTLTLFTPFTRYSSIESIYIGISLVALAAIGAFYKGKRYPEIRLIGVISIILIVLSFGTNTLFYELIPWSNLLLPERFLNILALTIALLSGCAVEVLINTKKIHLFRWILLAGICFVVVYDNGDYLRLIRTSEYADEKEIAEKMAEVPNSTHYLSLVPATAASEYFPITIGKKMSALGWAYEASYQGPSIALIIDAIKQHNYEYVLARLDMLDIGIVRFSIEDSDFKRMLLENGFTVTYENNESTLMVNYQQQSFSKALTASTLVIGKNPGSISEAFPGALVGSSPYLEDYDESLVNSFELLILSHMYSRNEQHFADLLERYLAKDGHQIVLNFPTYNAYYDPEPLKELQITLIPFAIKPTDRTSVDYTGSTENIRFTQDGGVWNGVLPENLDTTSAYLNSNGDRMSLIGTKQFRGKTVYVVGGNLFYDVLYNNNNATKKILTTLFPQLSSSAVNARNATNTPRYEIFPSTYSPNLIEKNTAEERKISTLERVTVVPIGEEAGAPTFTYEYTTLQKCSRMVSLSVFFLLIATILGNFFLQCLRSHHEQEHKKTAKHKSQTPAPT
ncbi:MAG: 6-pyruvoyl-tetrahydropterin synthase-related protein [bacterium]